MRAEPLTPQGIAGGFVLIPARQLLVAWRACRRRPLGVGDLRAWLACRELVARRCALDGGRAPTYSHAELSRLTGVHEKRARASVDRLVKARLLTWSDAEIGFPVGESDEPADDPIADSIGGGKGSLAIPRRMLRLLAGGARPALIATVLGILLRCLSRGRGGFKSRGRVKASWIARTFGVDLRRVKQARKDLIELGWISIEQTDQWIMNRWGATYHIDLAWNRDTSDPRRRSPPPPAPGGRRSPPPDSHPEPLREIKDQEPAPGGPSGVEIKAAGEEAGPLSPIVSAAPPPRKERTREPASRRPVTIADGAGGTPLPVPTLDDVRVADLKDTGRLLQLHDQAVARDLVGSSEADRLKFVAVAEHARAVGTANPCGLFARLVDRGWWHFVTQADEDAASVRLKRHLFGGPGGVVVFPGVVFPGVVFPGVVPRAAPLSADALLVRGVRAAVARAGGHADPFPVVRSKDASWTRGRWDRALAELEGAAGAGIGGRWAGLGPPTGMMSGPIEARPDAP